MFCPELFWTSLNIFVDCTLPWLAKPAFFCVKLILENLLRYDSKLIDYWLRIRPHLPKTIPMRTARVVRALSSTFQYINAKSGLFLSFLRVVGKGRSEKLLCPCTNPSWTSRSLHWASFCFFRMSQLRSIKWCRENGDKRWYASLLWQHSWLCMVAFPRRSWKKNSHLAHTLRDGLMTLIPRNTRVWWHDRCGSTWVQIVTVGASTFKYKTAVGTISLTSMEHLLRNGAISVSGAPTEKELDTDSQVLKGN